MACLVASTACLVEARACAEWVAVFWAADWRREKAVGAARDALLRRLNGSRVEYIDAPTGFTRERPCSGSSCRSDKTW